jgi:ASC-1-like (ASCH) protein
MPFYKGEPIMILEIIAELLKSIGHDASLNTKKIDKHIAELRKYNWFNDLYQDEKYHRLFFVNKRIRKYLQSTYKTKRLKNNTNAQNAFISFLDKQLLK